MNLKRISMSPQPYLSVEKNKKISYVIPVFNEELNISHSVARIISSVPWESGITDYEIVFVDDGSTDSTLSILENMIRENSKIRCLVLGRNYGHQAALSAGLLHTSGDFIAVLDGDLQDPPEIINRFLQTMLDHGNCDLVYGIRRNRKENSVIKLCYWAFYRFLRLVSQIEIPLDSGDFCLMSRPFLKTLNSLPEKNRFIRGLRSYVGYNQIGVEYERSERAAGDAKYTFSKLLGLASDGIFNFSDRPLKFASGLGISISILSSLIFLCLVIQRLFSVKVLGYSPSDIPGYTSLILTVTFFQGLCLLCVGLQGEYISRIFIESKNRPSYTIRRVIEARTVNDQ